MKHYDLCGDCDLFMTKKCPREPGDPIKKNWNSIGAFKCGKFERSKWSIEQEERDKKKAEEDRIKEIERRKSEGKILIDLFRSFH